MSRSGNPLICLAMHDKSLLKGPCLGSTLTLPSIFLTVLQSPSAVATLANAVHGLLSLLGAKAAFHSSAELVWHGDIYVRRGARDPVNLCYPRAYEGQT